MNLDTNAHTLDTVLTLRGHQVTLRRAIEEGIIRGRFDPRTGQAQRCQLDARRIMERSETWKGAWLAGLPDNRLFTCPAGS